MFENEILDYSSKKNKKMCMNCYNWYAQRCDSVYSEHYGCVTLYDSSCSSFNEIKENSKEKVNHPSHYNQGIEAIDIIESWGLNFSLGNAIKYILRAPHKDSQIEDLQKAKWYVERELERIQKLR